MKQWKIEYSIRTMDGEIIEDSFTVEAAMIQDALDEAFRTLVAMECEHPEIVETAVWDCGLIAEADDQEAPFESVA